MVQTMRIHTECFHKNISVSFSSVVEVLEMLTEYVGDFLN